MSIPVLQTERLILREFRADDIDAMAGIYSEPDVARFVTMDGKPQSRDNAWRSMATMMGHRTLHGYGMWAVEEKATGLLSGFVGPHYPEGWPGQEIGWAIAVAEKIGSHKDKDSVWNREGKELLIYAQPNPAV